MSLAKTNTINWRNKLTKSDKPLLYDEIILPPMTDEMLLAAP